MMQSLTQLNLILDRLIQFDTYGWRVRKDQDLVDSSGKVIGGNYVGEEAPGAGAALSRNQGKLIVPPVYTAGVGALGSYLGAKRRTGSHAAHIRSIRKGGLIGAGAGALLGASVGSQVDKARKLQGTRAEAMQAGYEDSLKARGITRRPVSMSARLDRLIQFEFKHIAGDPNKSGAVYSDESNDLYTPWEHVKAQAKKKGLDAKALWKGNRKGNMVRIVNANGTSSLHYTPEGKSRIPGEPDWEQRKRISRRAIIGIGTGVGLGGAAGYALGRAHSLR